MADKQVLARILKYTLDEFKEFTIDTIMKSMETPQISNVRVEPDHINTSKLGYHIDNRVIYYLGRMISAQKEVEFSKSNYDDLKAVKSIWVCMDAGDDEDSIYFFILSEFGLRRFKRSLKLNILCFSF